LGLSSSSRVKLRESLPLKVGRIGGPEELVPNHLTPLNNREDGRLQAHLKESIVYIKCCGHFIKIVKRLLGHVDRMDEMATPKRVLKGKLHAKRRTGRSRLRWTDDVTDDLRKMEIRGWIEKARNTDQWRLIVKEAKAHPGL
jgi:hypothetical protein